MKRKQFLSDTKEQFWGLVCGKLKQSSVVEINKENPSILTTSCWNIEIPKDNDDKI